MPILYSLSIRKGITKLALPSMFKYDRIDPYYGNLQACCFAFIKIILIQPHSYICII